MKPLFRKKGNESGGIEVLDKAPAGSLTGVLKGFGNGVKNIKPKKKVIVAVVCVAVLIAAFAGIRAFLAGRNRGAAETTYTVATVQRQNISVTLSGSGTLEPANSYAVTSLATGEILSSDFEEGDEVEEGTILYQIDTSDAETSIKSAELNLEKSQLSYDNIQETLGNLSVKAQTDGTVTELDVGVGDTVSNGQKIGSIRNSAVMSLKIPFNSADADTFSVGEAAEVTLDGTFEALTGTITKISSVEQVLTGNMLVKYVTIDVANPGGITDTTTAAARVGEVACNSGAAFTYKDEQTVTAKASGEVTAVYADEGDAVSKGQVLAVLQSSDVQQNVKSAQLSLEDAQNTLDNKKEALDDYTITSPIAGTIVEKDYKAGDKLDSGATSKTLCTIYDLSYLTMEMSVDELDVSKVAVGQEVTITADAVEGKTYTGVVTKVSISGTTSNGVTAYPVTIRIDETDGLLPGMNVNAEIVVESAKDALSVPVDAVNRGNQVLVLKNASSGSVAEGDTLQAGANGGPDGFEYAEVTLGVNNDDYIEITSGLEEGDIIAVVSVNTDSGQSTAASSFGMTGSAQRPQGGATVTNGAPGGYSSGGGPMGG